MPFLMYFIICTLVSLSCRSSRLENYKTGLRKSVDDLGKVVELDSRPERLVSLAPGITEILFFLGAGQRLVGVTNQCDWPARAGSIQKIGDFSNPSLERIIALSPDLVLTTSHEQARWIETISSLGIPIYTVYPSDCADLVSSMQRLLELLGDTAAGRDSIRTFSENLRTLDESQRGTDDSKPRVFIEISSSPLMTAGEASFVSDLITRAGGSNIAVNLERDYSIINPERVILDNPEVIFIFHGLTTAHDLSLRIGWQDIEAVKNGRVFDDVDPDLVLRPGPRVLQGIERIRERLGGDH